MAETRTGKRLRASFLASRLIKYDVISFDIFDTLILRNVSEPKDVFAFLATKYSLLDFAKIRVEEERKLREKKREIYGNHEVTIREIYDEIYKLTSINPQIGIRNELEEEKNFCYANPYMKIVFDTLIQNGKKVIITSDMYLPHDLMSELLESCGYVGYDKLFVSCDYYCNKRDLGLYEYIKENYLQKDETVIHVGDNHQTDYLNAKQVGWDAYHYPKCKSLGEPLDKIGMSFITGSYYCSIVNNFLYNGANEGYPYDQEEYKYGFMYGGLFVLGYVNWIHKKAVENKMDKIIFLARDGYILKKVYDMIYTDIPSEYALWSRHASMKTSIKTNITTYLWQFIHRRKQYNPEITVGNILRDMEFDFLISKLNEKQILESDFIGSEQIEEKLEELIKENIEQIKKVSFKYSELEKDYYKKIVGDSKSTYIVDVGWKASGALSLKYLFEKEWGFDCKAKALISGTYKVLNNRDSVFHLNKEIESYMFSQQHNTDLLLMHQRNTILNNTVIEIFTSAPMPSFLKSNLSNNDTFEFIFDIPEVENYKKIDLIFKGEIDFIKQYIKHLNGNTELLDISGRDAYYPLKYLMQGKKLHNFSKVFKNFVYNSLIGGIKDEKNKNFETFIEVYRRKKG